MKNIAETMRTGIVIAASAAGLAALLTAAVPRAAHAEEIDSVVASVDGDPITAHDLKSPGPAGGAAGSSPSGALLMAPASPGNSQAALKAAIEQKLLEREAQKYAAKVDDDEVDRYIQNLERQGGITDDQLHAQLRAQNVSYDDFRAKVRKQVEAMTMVDREVRQKIVIPEAEIENYYKDNPGEFTTSEEKFELAQILIAVPAGATPQQVEALHQKAEDVRKQAVKKGADFGSLALKYSDDDSKTKGGELGEFAPGDLNDEVLAAIKNSKDGDISPVVKTKYGFHIVLVEKHQSPGVKPLDQVRGQIRDKLMTEQARDRFQKWVDTELIKQHYVETLQQ